LRLGRQYLDFLRTLSELCQCWLCKLVNRIDPRRERETGGELKVVPTFV
jgi:hypothetical protein